MVLRGVANGETVLTVLPRSVPGPWSGPGRRNELGAGLAKPTTPQTQCRWRETPRGHRGEMGRSLLTTWRRKETGRAVEAGQRWRWAPAAPAGWGLSLVADLAICRGVETTSDARVVWAEFALAPSRQRLRDRTSIGHPQGILSSAVDIGHSATEQPQESSTNWR